MFGPQWDVNGEWRKLHNDELLTSNIRVLNLALAGPVVRMGEVRTT